MVKKKKKKFYVLECSVEGCNAEFYLNGIPIIRRGPDLGKKYGGPCNQYLVDGLNELSAIINPGPTPGESLSSQAGRDRVTLKENIAVQAKLSRYPFGSVMGGPDGKELMSLSWQLGEGESAVFQKTASVRHDLGPLFGVWAWQEAPRIELNEKDQEEIHKFIEILHMSLEAGDPEPFIELSQTRLQETERAFDLNPGEKKELIRKVTLDDAEQNWWGMQTLEKSQYDLRLCAQDRLVELIQKDWKPILRECEDEQGGVGSYAMMIGKIKGQWHIVR